MNADFCFRMGATHAICQDYAVAGVRGELAYAILSDGCSGSPVPGEPGSPYTDFGARLLVRATIPGLEILVQGGLRGYDWLVRTIYEVERLAKAAQLPQTSLDATLLAAVGTREGGIHVWRSGDGVIVARTRTGEIQYNAFEFGNSTPLYLSYLLDDARRSQCLEQAETMTVRQGVVGIPERSSAYTNELSDLLGHMIQKLGPHLVHGASGAPLTALGAAFTADEYDLVLLFSDGVESFYEVGTGRPVPLEEVLAEVCAIKGFTGQFLARRCQRFLGAVCQERGWRHADDFSVAGIYLGDAP